MSEAPDLSTRVTRLEERMAEVHHLASRADHEASEVHVRLRAHTKSLEALRETQLEQGREMREMRAGLKRVETEMREGFKQVDARFKRLEAKMDDRFDKFEAWARGGFATMARSQEQITTLLNSALKASGET